VSSASKDDRGYHNGNGLPVSLKKMENSTTGETGNDAEIARLLNEEYVFVQIFPLLIHRSLDRRICRTASNALLTVSVERTKSPSIPTPLVEGSSNVSPCCEVSDESTEDRSHHVGDE
jgi:hypothetical protein